MSDDSKKSLRCSFCGKHENQVHRMIQGPGVRICDECVQLCMSILSDGFDDEDVEPLEDMPDKLPTPRETEGIISENLSVERAAGLTEKPLLLPFRDIPDSPMALYSLSRGRKEVREGTAERDKARIDVSTRIMEILFIADRLP